MTEQLTPDICIIGAGSAGLTAAAAAAAFGVSVVLVEQGAMGGDCLNVGCVPSKALIAAARHAHSVARAAEFGIGAGPAKVDYERVHAHIHEVIAAIAPNDSVERFSALGVRVIRAAARFTDARTLKAGEFEVRARRFLIATGSRPLIPEMSGLSEVDYLTNESLFDMRELPARLVVIGGGPVGLEMAQAFRRLGSEVTVLEAGRILGREDRELAAVVERRLSDEGLRVVEGVSVTRVERSESGGVRVRWTRGGVENHVEGDRLLVAVGRKPSVEGLGLDAAGVAHDAAGIRTGANLRTSNRRIYAAGDVVAGAPRFTHVAGYHAGLVVQQMLFRLPARQVPGLLPRVTFIDPQIAHVGLDEDEARATHRTVRILRWPNSENDRSRAERSTDGLIKIVTDRKGRLLGASIVGESADEMIGLWALALAKRMTVADIRAYVAPYPTRGEIGKRAALAYYNPLTRKTFVRKTVRFLRRFG